MNEQQTQQPRTHAAPAGSAITEIAAAYGPWEASHFAKGDGW